MAIRYKLTKSIIGLTTLYWVVFTLIFVFTEFAESKEQATILGVEIEYTSPSKDFNHKLSIAQKWIPSAVSAFITTSAISIIFILIIALLQDRSRAKRRKTNDSYRGLSVTLTNLPRPAALKFKQFNFNIPSARLSEEHQNLINDILSLIKQYPVPAGDGHGVNLLDHTLNVLHKALDMKIYDGNTLCALAGHDLGKITTFKLINGEWEIHGKHDNEGAKLLSELPSWYEMNTDDRWIILFTIKYSHKPNKLPAVMKNKNKIEDCLRKIRHIDHNTTADEKREVVEQIKETEGLWYAFSVFLREAQFRDNNSSGKGKEYAGFVRSDKVYFHEKYFKYEFLKKRFPDIYASYNENEKIDNFYSKLTKELLNELHKRKLLVLEFKDIKAKNPTLARWDVTTDGGKNKTTGEKNKVTFKKVIIIHLTEEIHNLVGNKTYHKPINVIGLTQPPNSGQNQTPASANTKGKNKHASAIEKHKKENSKQQAQENTPNSDETIKHTDIKASKTQPQSVDFELELTSATNIKISDDIIDSLTTVNIEEKNKPEISTKNQEQEASQKPINNEEKPAAHKMSQTKSHSEEKQTKNNNNSSSRGDTTQKAGATSATMGIGKASEEKHESQPQGTALETEPTTATKNKISVDTTDSLMTVSTKENNKPKISTKTQEASHKPKTTSAPRGIGISKELTPEKKAQNQIFTKAVKIEKTDDESKKLPLDNNIIDISTTENLEDERSY